MLLAIHLHLAVGPQLQSLAHLVPLAHKDQQDKQELQDNQDNKDPLETQELLGEQGLLETHQVAVQHAQLAHQALKVHLAHQDSQVNRALLVPQEPLDLEVEEEEELLVLQDVQVLQALLVVLVAVVDL